MKFCIYALSALFLILQISCGGQTLKDYNQKSYVEGKLSFDSALISHFPEKLSSDSSAIVRREREDFNDVGFFLYEYDLSGENIDKVLLSLQAYKPITIYESVDTCLLIVNRFEHEATYDNFAAPKVIDSTLINRDCYANLLPIPNFIDYITENVTACSLDSTFTIYVLEAKPNNPFTQFDLQPFKHMPEKWANGYSRGIAISKRNKTVIYWSIIW